MEIDRYLGEKSSDFDHLQDIFGAIFCFKFSHGGGDTAPSPLSTPLRLEQKMKLVHTCAWDGTCPTPAPGSLQRGSQLDPKRKKFQV